MERSYDNETMDRYIRYEAEIVSLLEDVRKYNDGETMQVLLESLELIVKRRISFIQGVRKMEHDMMWERLIDNIKGIERTDK
jgi:hypothetical protein